MLLLSRGTAFVVPATARLPVVAGDAIVLGVVSCYFVRAAVVPSTVARCSQCPIDFADCMLRG
jgi:hypothetical protein